MVKVLDFKKKPENSVRSNSLPQGFRPPASQTQTPTNQEELINRLIYGVGEEKPLRVRPDGSGLVSRPGHAQYPFSKKAQENQIKVDSPNLDLRQLTLLPGGRRD